MISVLGGFLMIVGALFTYHGRINHSVATYVLADIIWLINAYRVETDLYGAITIAIATLLGLGAYWKMNTGKMRKNLNNEH